MLDYQMTDVRQFVTPKASIVGERHRFKPELGVAAGVRDVDVRRFAPLETVKVEAVPAYSQVAPAPDECIVQSGRSPGQPDDSMTLRAAIHRTRAHEPNATAPLVERQAC